MTSKVDEVLSCASEQDDESPCSDCAEAAPLLATEVQILTADIDNTIRLLREWHERYTPDSQYSDLWCRTNAHLKEPSDE